MKKMAIYYETEVNWPYTMCVHRMEGSKYCPLLGTHLEYCVLFGAFITGRREARRLPLRQFGGAGALNIDEVKENNCVCILENRKLNGQVIEVFQYLKVKY